MPPKLFNALNKVLSFELIIRQDQNLLQAIPAEPSYCIRWLLKMMGITKLMVVLFSTGLCAQHLKFDFGHGTTAKGYTKVAPDTKFNTNTGYGFLGNSAPIVAVERKGKNNLLSDYCTSSQPFFFSVQLPEGNYDVTVITGDAEGTSATTIKAECRRLMVEKAITANGKFLRNTFTVNIRDSIIHATGEKIRLKPREKTYLHWDNALTLEFSNEAPKICGIEIKRNTSAATVFLAGNSTVVDQAQEPYAAWGQMIPAFFQPGKVVFANYAESGEALRSFASARRLDKIISLMKKGDYLFVEFAHNDQKPGSAHVEPFTTYKEQLKKYIAAARSKGGIPVLVTSMHRRNFDANGKIINTLGDYPAAMRETAREENVALIDLNEMSKTLYEALGETPSLKAFVHYAANSFPNQPQPIQDNTHFSNYGAYELAKCVVTGIRQSIPALARQLKKDLPVFDPAKPSPAEAFVLPHSPLSPVVKPDGN